MYFGLMIVDIQKYIKIKFTLKGSLKCCLNKVTGFFRLLFNDSMAWYDLHFKVIGSGCQFSDEMQFVLFEH